MKTQAEIQARRRGERDYEKGVQEGRNPFPAGSKEAAEWLAGFQDAATDDDGPDDPVESFED